MKSKKMTVQQKNKRTIDILSACISVLLALIVAASVVLGVGFGKYGKDTNDWFKPGTTKPDEVLPTPIAIGDKISFTADGEGLPLYINTSDEAVAAIDSKVEDIMENGGSFDTYYLLLGLFCNVEIPEDTKVDENFDFPDGSDRFALLLVVTKEGEIMIGIMSLQDAYDGAILYAHLIDPDDVEDGKNVPTEGFQNDSIDDNGRIVLASNALLSDDYYVCDKNIMAGGWFAMADDDFVNKLFSTTPFVKA